MRGLPPGTRRNHGGIWKIKQSDGTWKPVKSLKIKTGEYVFNRRPAGHGGPVKLTRSQLDDVLHNRTYGLISAGKNPLLEPDMTDAEQAARHEQLRADLKAGGYAYTEVDGHYGGHEKTFLVMAHDISHKELQQLGEKYNQDSVIHARKGENSMYFTTGDHSGKRHRGEGHEIKNDATDFFTVVKHPDGGTTKFALNFDFDKIVKSWGRRPTAGSYEALMKAALPVGHVSTYADGTQHKKQASGKWLQLADARQKESAKSASGPSLDGQDDTRSRGLGLLSEYNMTVVGNNKAQALKIAQQVKDGIEESANICEMSPPVCADNMGIVRGDMPQILDAPLSSLMGTKHEWKAKAAIAAGADPNEKRDMMTQMLDALQDEGVKVTEGGDIAVGQLKATQKEIQAEKTFGMADSALKGKFNPGKSPIIITSDNYILDGHHRFAASLTISPSRKMNTTVVDMPMKDLLKFALRLPGVFRADIDDQVVPASAPEPSYMKKGLRFTLCKAQMSLWTREEMGRSGGVAGRTDTINRILTEAARGARRTKPGGPLAEAAQRAQLGSQGHGSMTPEDIEALLSPGRRAADAARHPVHVLADAAQRAIAAKTPRSSHSGLDRQRHGKNVRVKLDSHGKPHVMAIGVRGGKIVGYRNGKPIYMDKWKAAQSKSKASKSKPRGRIDKWVQLADAEQLPLLAKEDRVKGQIPLLVVPRKPRPARRTPPRSEPTPEPVDPQQGRIDGNFRSDSPFTNFNELRDWIAIDGAKYHVRNRDGDIRVRIEMPGRGPRPYIRFTKHRGKWALHVPAVNARDALLVREHGLVRRAAFEGYSIRDGYTPTAPRRLIRDPHMIPSGVEVIPAPIDLGSPGGSLSGAWESSRYNNPLKLVLERYGLNTANDLVTLLNPPEGSVIKVVSSIPTADGNPNLRVTIEKTSYVGPATSSHPTTDVKAHVTIKFPRPRAMGRGEPVVMKVWGDTASIENVAFSDRIAQMTEARATTDLQVRRFTYALNRIRPKTVAEKPSESGPGSIGHFFRPDIPGQTGFDFEGGSDPQQQMLVFKPAEADFDAIRTALGRHFCDGSGVNITDAHPTTTASVSAELFGEALTPKQIAALTGAPPGAAVIITSQNAYNGPQIRLTVTGPGGLIMTRQIHRQPASAYRDDQPSQLVMSNAYFRAGAANIRAKRKLGSRCFASQAAWASKLGIDRIVVAAAGSPGDTVYNGYYTWARFGYQQGYDFDNPGTVRGEDGHRVTFQEQMSTQEGRDWWMANGHGWDGAFDLRPGSYGMSTIAAYGEELNWTAVSKAEVITDVDNQKEEEIHLDDDELRALDRANDRVAAAMRKRAMDRAAEAVKGQTLSYDELMKAVPPHTYADSKQRAPVARTDSPTGTTYTSPRPAKPYKTNAKTGGYPRATAKPPPTPKKLGSPYPDPKMSPMMRPSDRYKARYQRMRKENMKPADVSEKPSSDTSEGQTTSLAYRARMDLAEYRNSKRRTKRDLPQAPKSGDRKYPMYGGDPRTLGGRGGDRGKLIYDKTDERRPLSRKDARSWRRLRGRMKAQKQREHDKRQRTDYRPAPKNEAFDRKIREEVRGTKLRNPYGKGGGYGPPCQMCKGGSVAPKHSVCKGCDGSGWAPWVGYESEQFPVNDADFPVKADGTPSRQTLSKTARKGPPKVVSGVRGRTTTATAGYPKPRLSIRGRNPARPGAGNKWEGSKEQTESRARTRPDRGTGDKWEGSKEQTESKHRAAGGYSGKLKTAVKEGLREFGTRAGRGDYGSPTVGSGGIPLHHHPGKRKGRGRKTDRPDKPAMVLESDSSVRKRSGFPQPPAPPKRSVRHNLKPPPERYVPPKQASKMTRKRLVVPAAAVAPSSVPVRKRRKRRRASEGQLAPATAPGAPADVQVKPKIKRRKRSPSAIEGSTRSKRQDDYILF